MTATGCWRGSGTCRYALCGLIFDLRHSRKRIRGIRFECKPSARQYAHRQRWPDPAPWWAAIAAATRCSALDWP
jgi:hypothetical protein